MQHMSFTCATYIAYEAYVAYATQVFPIYADVFSRGHTTLEIAMSVGRSFHIQNKMQAFFCFSASAHPSHYVLRAHHLRTRKNMLALLTYDKGRNWCSCLFRARKYMVLPAP